MKKILGLDLGTNSIGWALIEHDFEKQKGEIKDIGSRIIPMSQDILGDFEKGNSVSQTSKRTGYRGTRRLRERHLLRRERIHRVLNILDFLPEHYAKQIDFKKYLGKFLEGKEPKLAWKKNKYNKHEFLFKDSFNEMLEDFKINQPELNKGKNKKNEQKEIPHDWTIYFLRKKALSKKITEEELAWIILNFNQKRGYYQLRGEEEEENPNKLVEFHSLKVLEVTSDEQPNSKGQIWYTMLLENGWEYRRASKTPLFEWKGKKRDFIVTTNLNNDGSVKTDKEGEEKRTFRAPKDDDWTLVKKKTEHEINNSDKTVGTFIYDTLLQNPSQKIRGKLVRTIERKFYKEELKEILKMQIELQPSLFTKDLFKVCINELYPHNESHQSNLLKKDFVHLFVEDIIFYQRPLRSQKSSITNCSLEYRVYFYKNDKGERVKRNEYLKAIPKSHPLYQEFRLWQWLHNLKIYKKENDQEVTNEFIQTIEDKEKLFDFLKSKKEVNHKDILKFLFSSSELKGKKLNTEISKYRWNYIYDPKKDESRKYPCNETGYQIGRRLSKVKEIPNNFLTPKIEQHLWHIIYSVTDKNDFVKALKTFANKYNLDKDSFVEQFKKFPPFESDYGTFSEKAIKRILPLLRLGKYWSWNKIDQKTLNRINKIIDGEYDEEIKNRVREKTINLTKKENFQGLSLWLAQYIIYDRHSEAANAGKWHSSKDLKDYLKEFKQHSLRNPIVEQVVTETLRVVKDIWEKHGNGEEDFFDEIHIELGREMKQTADQREKATARNSDRQNTNLRIKTFLIELLNDNEVENVRPYSPSQQEALKIYENDVLNSGIEIPDDIQKISQSAEPTKSEFQRYKLWLEQKYKSPYTGMPIPLNKLFTENYEIEHIIPQSRYFDNSFTNKVICESAVNKLKDRQLGMEFIKNHQGTIVETGFGKTVKVLSEDAYEHFITEHYSFGNPKRKKLLMEDIPDKMIERQMNDTRYISKFVSNLLSNIVRDKEKDDGVNSKNVLPGNGKITTNLKRDWGLNDVWNDLVLPRYERMNKLTNSENFTKWNERHKVFIPTIPLEYSKGFSKKRIDHRHHAMDALVIACATRNHINLLNNTSANYRTERYDLQIKLRNKENYIREKDGKKGKRFTNFIKPWDSFTIDAKNELGKIVISFKQNIRVINRTNNNTWHWEKQNGNWKKKLQKQKGKNFAIRKPLHKETVSGRIKIKTPIGKIATATRTHLSEIKNQKHIDKITDKSIQRILQNHVRNYLNEKEKEDFEAAFSQSGIETLNKNIKELNRGMNHQPIYKVKQYEIGEKFNIGETGNNPKKYVETAKGTNLFFAVYWNEEKQKRVFETIPLNKVIEHQKQTIHLPMKDKMPIPIDITKGEFLFYLSPNDLVYVPSEDEQENIGNIDFQILSKEQINGIYKMVSCTGSECHFVHSLISSLIKSYDADSQIGELGSLNKLELTLNGDTRIKETCIKLKVDRLGNIKKA